MKGAENTFWIVIGLIIVVVAAFFILSYLGLIPGISDIFKRQAIQSKFCQELQQTYQCSVEYLAYSEFSTITSSKIKNSEIGLAGDDPAQFGNICAYLLGKKYSTENDWNSCLSRCGCKTSS